MRITHLRTSLARFLTVLVASAVLVFGCADSATNPLEEVTVPGEGLTTSHMFVTPLNEACDAGYYNGEWYWWWECWDNVDPWADGGGGAYSGSGSHNYVSPQPCDPVKDPECEKLLEKWQQDLLTRALKSHVKDLDNIPDVTAREECKATGLRLRGYITDGKIFAGKYNMPAGHPSQHEAAFDVKTLHIHIDPAAWTAAKRNNKGKWQLANSVLHEVMHAMGKDHPSEGLPSPWGYIYSDPWFNRLSPGTNSCLKTYPSN